jgi:hypothetical protein
MAHSEKRHASIFQIPRRGVEQHDVGTIHEMGLSKTLRFQNL